MKVRSALLLAAVVPLVAGSTTALAGAAPSCNIVTDPTGDASVSGAAPGSSNEDIVSGDLASDGKVVTGVIRLAALAQPDPQAPLGQSFNISWSAKGSDNQLFLSARTYPNGTKYVYGYQGVDPTSGINTSYTLGDATGVIDTAKKEVRISAPNAAFKEAGTTMPKASKLLAPLVQVYRIFGQSVVPSQTVGGQRVPLSGLNLRFDDAEGKNYVVGTKSCVTPGK